MTMVGIRLIDKMQWDVSAKYPDDQYYLHLSAEYKLQTLYQKIWEKKQLDVQDMSIHLMQRNQEGYSVFACAYLHEKKFPPIKTFMDGFWFTAGILEFIGYVVRPRRYHRLRRYHRPRRTIYSRDMKMFHFVWSIYKDALTKSPTKYTQAQLDTLEKRLKDDVLSEARRIYAILNSNHFSKP